MPATTPPAVATPRRRRAKKRKILAAKVVAKKPIEGFRPQHVELARRVCAYLGATIDELASVIGVPRQTLQYWALRHPDLAAALNQGKIEADGVVAERLFMRAKGWEHEAVKIFLVDETTVTRMPNGDEVTTTVKKPLMVPYLHREPPDTMAGMYWLNNRRTQDWRRRDKADTGPAAPTTNNYLINLDGMNADQRSQLRQLLLLTRREGEVAPGTRQG